MSRSSIRNLARLVIAIAFIAVLAWALRGTEFDASRLVSGLGRAREYVSQMYPPDWWELPRALKALIVTVQMAIVGTFLGVAAALPVSFLAARTDVLPRSFSSAVKTCLNVLRAIPAFIYAILFVYVVGLGPFPGALGIGVGAFVMLAKLFAEALESVHPSPIEGVKAAGGRPLQVFAYAMLPQALPQFLSHTLYAWEISISAATIVGLVGAGGIGFELTSNIQYMAWQKVAVYILVLVAMILVADTVSYQIRKRVT